MTSQAQAAKCITLHIPGYKPFHPEFTHQLFGITETIRGYRPIERTEDTKFESNLDESRESTGRKRVKFSDDPAPNSNTNEPTLDISIHLNPICTQCQIHYECKYDEDNADNATTTSSSNSISTETITRMTKDEIILKLQKALPAITNELDHDEHLSKPIGHVLKEYENNSKTFVLCLGDGSDQSVCEYHDKVQNLALWFIESADCVDVSSDDGGGHWKVLYLFEKKQEDSDLYRYSLAGYITLFYFNAPFKRPKGGFIKRVCQVLVFPPYQRNGHGRKMLNLVYREAYQNEIVVEVNVEDPAPSFTSLRDRIDYERLLLSISEPNNELSKMRLPSKYVENNPELDTFYHVLPASEAILIGVHAKVVPRQVQIAHEIYKLKFLLDWLHSSTQQNPNHDSLASSYNGVESVPQKQSSLSDSLQKKYRLMVKQRLVKVCAEELGTFDDKKAKQAKLEQIYQEVTDHYCKVLRRAFPKAIIP